MSALVYSPNLSNYRRVAQKHYGLTNEQMTELDIHHNPPRCMGGRNIPEHLYVYHPIMHKRIHDKQTIEWASKSSGNKTSRRGKPPSKTELRPIEIEIGQMASRGMSRREIMEVLGLSENQVKRAVSQCRRFGLGVETKSGPKRGTPQCGGNPTGINQFTNRG